MVVVVTDKGVPARSSNATVTITITDVNDNIPVITNLPATAAIKEVCMDYTCTLKCMLSIVYSLGTTIYRISNQFLNFVNTCTR